jgi:hypothetical protein
VETTWVRWNGARAHRAWTALSFPEDLVTRAPAPVLSTQATSDVIDASVVLCARARGHAIATSGAGDLRRLDPKVTLVEV